MFIDTASNSITRAPAERNVPSLVRGDQTMFRSAGARKTLRDRPFYKHLAPNGAKRSNVLLHFETEFANDKCQMTNGKLVGYQHWIWSTNHQNRGAFDRIVLQRNQRRCANSPSTTCRSVRQTPHARTRTNTSSSAGDGCSMSINSSGRASIGAGERNTQAFILPRV